MKITKRKITASSEVVKIPSPLDKYYRIVTDKEVEDYTGYPGDDYPCESAEGYQIKHVGWAMAKDEYLDALAGQGLDLVELVTSGWKGPELMLAYVVHDRVYPVDMSDIEMAGIEGSTQIKAADDGSADDAFEGDVVAGVAAKLSVPYDKAEEIFNWYDQRGLLDKFTTISEILDYIEEDYDPSDLESLYSSTGIEGAIDTGLTYWYFTRHGLGPGMMPKDVQIVDWYEDGYKTWFKTDKLLTTSELDEFDIQEQNPPEGVTTHNGDVIEGCDNITASEVTKVAEDDTSIDFVVSCDDSGKSGKTVLASSEGNAKFSLLMDFIDNSIDEVFDQTGEELTYQDCLNWLEDADFSVELLSEGQTFDELEVSKDDMTAALDEYFDKSYVVDYDLSKMDWEKEEAKRREREAVDEADFWDLEHGEGIYEEVEGRSLVNYCDYRIMSNPEAGCWDILEKNYKLVKSGFPTEGSAKNYIDSELACDVSSSNKIESTLDLGSFDREGLEAELNDVCSEYIDRNFPDDESKSYSVSINETSSDGENVVTCQVTADIPQDKLIELEHSLDEVISIYDSDAYFELTDDGLLKAQMWATSPVTGSTQPGESEYISSDDDIAPTPDELESYYNTLNPRRMDRQHSDDDWYNQPEDQFFEITFDGVVDIDKDGDWKFEDESFWDEYKENGYIDLGTLQEDFDGVLAWGMPVSEGKTQAKGEVDLTYKPVKDNDGYVHYNLDTSNSYIAKLDLSPLGNIESSTTVEAAMTEDELDNAILEGKPFDIESFQKWKGTDLPKDSTSLRADQIEVGDVIEVTEDASEVDLGTRVKVLSINDPGENWIDYTFHVELLDKPGRKDFYDDVVLKAGDEMDIHFDADEYVGPLVLT